MKLLAKQIAAFVVIILALAALPAAGQAKEDKSVGLFVNLTTNDQSLAGHALAIAGSAKKQGHPVTIFLNHEAVMIAADGAPSTSFQGKSLTEHLKAAIADGAKVIVCGWCMENHAMTEPQLLDGAVVTSDESINDYIFDPAYKVMTW